MSLEHTNFVLVDSLTAHRTVRQITHLDVFSTNHVLLPRAILVTTAIWDGDFFSFVFLEVGTAYCNQGRWQLCVDMNPVLLHIKFGVDNT
jgi:hypothetical protein